uniref:pyruvate kinase n=2 Tax=Acidithiobacillus ferrianus TaxID=2678518 RepID=A0A845U5R7_9PROT|nr:pyruvate kinase [Acidithiobacillus ferrianus]NDU42223.1 pyruvate kinase [Acidithiobacillus ferrianus]
MPTRAALWNDLLDSLLALRDRVLDESEKRLAALDHQDPGLRLHPGVRNVVHYLVLRSVDIRPLQEALAREGLSSLGRCESHVLDSIERIIAVLRAATGKARGRASDASTTRDDEDASTLRSNTEILLGPAPGKRNTRIMVTLPGERATDLAFMKELLTSGMDIARINCAHDSPVEWAAMARTLRVARQETERPCKILADLAGHKIRTGPLATEEGVLHLRPMRDHRGRVVLPAHCRAAWKGNAQSPLPPVDCQLLPLETNRPPEVGEVLRCMDARGKERRLEVESVTDAGVTLSCPQSVYLMNGTPWQSDQHRRRHGHIAGIPETPTAILLAVGDHLLLTRDALPGAAAEPDHHQPARISCTIPSLVERLPLGQKVWMDDGKFGAEVVSQSPDGALLQITVAKPGGDRLFPDRGLNFPGLPLDLPPLSDKDRADLDVIVPLVDMIGFSFVESAAHMRALRDALSQRQATHLGIIAKIETAQAFHRLPEILLAAIGRQPLGVMVARGDLAMEVGPERLTEVQEEILWLADAAHLPVVWATQVLESLAKRGMISRPELTDAAMDERAECVMLNKGPYIGQAVHTLDDILTRMQGHQRKKFALMRALHWS